MVGCEPTVPHGKFAHVQARSAQYTPTNVTWGTAAHDVQVIVLVYSSGRTEYQYVYGTTATYTPTLEEERWKLRRAARLARRCKHVPTVDPWIPTRFEPDAPPAPAWPAQLRRFRGNV